MEKKEEETENCTIIKPGIGSAELIPNTVNIYLLIISIKMSN